MTRDEVAAETGIRLANVLAKVGIAATDTTGNLKEPIDDALQAMEYGEDELSDAKPESRRVFIAIVRYFTLQRVLGALPTQFDASLPGGLSASRSQVFKQVDRLLTLAYEDVVRVYGELDVARSGLITMDLNYLEPGDGDYAERYA